MAGSTLHDMCIHTLTLENKVWEHLVLAFKIFCVKKKRHFCPPTKVWQFHETAKQFNIFCSLIVSLQVIILDLEDQVSMNSLSLEAQSVEGRDVFWILGSITLAGLPPFEKLFLWDWILWKAPSFNSQQKHNCFGLMPGPGKGRKTTTSAIEENTHFSY